MNGWSIILLMAALAAFSLFCFAMGFLTGASWAKVFA